MHRPGQPITGGTRMGLGVPSLRTRRRVCECADSQAGKLEFICRWEGRGGGWKAGVGRWPCTGGRAAVSSGRGLGSSRPAAPIQPPVPGSPRRTWLHTRVSRVGSGAGVALSCVGEGRRWAFRDRKVPGGLQAGQGHGFWETGRCWWTDRGGLLSFRPVPRPSPRQLAQGPARPEVTAVQREQVVGPRPQPAVSAPPWVVFPVSPAAGWMGSRAMEAGEAPARGLRGVLGVPAHEPVTPRLDAPPRAPRAPEALASERARGSVGAECGLGRGGRSPSGRVRALRPRRAPLGHGSVSWVWLPRASPRLFDGRTQGPSGEQRGQREVERPAGFGEEHDRRGAGGRGGRHPGRIRAPDSRRGGRGQRSCRQPPDVNVCGSGAHTSLLKPPAPCPVCAHVTPHMWAQTHATLAAPAARQSLLLTRSCRQTNESRTL